MGDGSRARSGEISFVSRRRRPLAIQLAGLGAVGVMCGSLCACGAMSEPPPSVLNDKVMSAVKENDVEAVRTLLQQGAPVDARGSGEGSDEGYTALLYAVEHRFLPLTRLLLHSGADPTLSAGPQNVFPLLKAARAGERDMLVLLLDYRANINQKRPGDGMDALAVACLEGHLTIVEMLVARNAAVEPQDLSYAIGAGHVDVAKRLLEAGADPAWTFNGRTMTQVARESPARTRGDLEALLQRYAARRNESHMQHGEARPFDRLAQFTGPVDPQRVAWLRAERLPRNAGRPRAGPQPVAGRPVRTNDYFFAGFAAFMVVAEMVSPLSSPVSSTSCPAWLAICFED